MLKRCVSQILIALLCSASWSMAQPQRPIIRNPNNPPLFQRFAAPPSGWLRFLMSSQGRKLLRRSRTPAAMAMLKALGEDITVQPPPAYPVLNEESAPETAIPSGVETAQQTPNLAAPLIAQSANIPVVNGCGANGTVFNLEPAANAAPQFSEAVDFFYNGVAAGADLVAEGATDFGLSGTSYYVHTATAGCAPAFQGTLPDITPGLSGETDFGQGEAAVVADGRHGYLYMADLHTGSNNSGGTSAIGLFRSFYLDLKNTAKCPAGVHTAAQAKTCWALSKLINPLPGPFGPYQQDLPSLAADVRVGGVGAANVYVTGTEFDFNANTSRTWLVACTYFFSCSSPVVISGGDTGAQFSNVQVRPDGGITISYVNESNGNSAAIKYVACLPQGAPVTPSCSPPVLVLNDPAPLSGSLIAEQFSVDTFPKHAHRVVGGVTQTFVVWDRCKVISTQDFCPDADILMKVSTNNGLTWGPLAFVDSSLDDQFFPAVFTDASRNTVNIAYYSNHGDPQFQHRINVILKQILPGSTTPTAALSVTTTPNDPSSDLFFVGPQDYIGMSAKGTGAAGQSHIYIGFTSNLRQGTYAGIPAPQADNYVARLVY
jgi:hypothetical protein